MAYRLPSFPLTIYIWRYSSHLGVLPPITAPDVVSVANLTVGRRVTGSGMIPIFLLLPTDCDLRSSESGHFSSFAQTDRDICECPALSGRYYSVVAPVQYSGQGFPNEHKIACVIAGWEIPSAWDV